jgi:hypothetical protein
MPFFVKMARCRLAICDSFPRNYSSSVNLSAGIRVIAGVYHIQNVNACDIQLKHWMKRFHAVLRLGAWKIIWLVKMVGALG